VLLLLLVVVTVLLLLLLLLLLGVMFTALAGVAPGPLVDPLLLLLLHRPAAASPTDAAPAA
jgi:hypothetical protein